MPMHVTVLSMYFQCNSDVCANVLLSAYVCQCMSMFLALVLGGFKFDKQQLDMNLKQFEITYITEKLFFKI